MALQFEDPPKAHRGPKISILDDLAELSKSPDRWAVIWEGKSRSGYQLKARAQSRKDLPGDGTWEFTTRTVGVDADGEKVGKLYARLVSEQA